MGKEHAARLDIETRGVFVRVEGRGGQVERGEKATEGRATHEA